MANAPKDSEKPPTQKQLDVRQRFQQASIYSRSALKDSATKEAYGAQAKEGQTRCFTRFLSLNATK